MASRTRRRQLWATLVAMAVFGTVVAGSVLYALSLPAEYTGIGVMQFSPRPVRTGPVVGNETVAAAASGSVAYLGAPSTIQGASATVGISSTELRDGLQVTLVPDTTTVTVDFTATSPAQAADVTNAMMNSAVKRAKSDPLVVASVLAKASVPQNPSGPPRIVIAAAGGLLAIILAGITLALFLTPSRRWSLARLVTGGTDDQAEARPTRGQQADPSAPSGADAGSAPPYSPTRVVTVEPAARSRGDG